MLDRYRKKVDWLFEPIARKTSIGANTLTYISLIFAFFAAVSFYFSYEHRYLLFLASFMVLMNGFLDALDGKVARLRNEASSKGDFIDHSIDRFADALIVGGLAASPWCKIFDWSFMQWVMVYFAVVGIATAVQRFVAVLRWFGKR